MLPFGGRARAAGRLPWGASFPRFFVHGALCLLVVLALSGCQTLSYYRQAIAGQCEILAHEQPIAKLLADPGTSSTLKTKLEQVLEIRRFAQDHLSLPVDNQYLKYVDLHRTYVVWNVNVAPALSLSPKTWWFPFVGQASYRGYFAEKDARRYAATFERKGWDVYVDGVETYSTLGWLRDPVLSTFIDQSEAELAEVIFHELTHQRLFVGGDTDFNEALAIAVSEEGVRRFLEATHQEAAYGQYRRDQEKERQFVRLVMGARARLAALYDEPQLSEASKRTGKAEIIAQLRADYQQAKKHWSGQEKGYDYWCAQPINNAKLNTVSAYFDLVPGFQAMLRQEGGDLDRFFHAVQNLAKLPLEQRHQALRKFQ